jgi:hypothetical protein
VSRRPDGRYGCQAAQIPNTPVPVTCERCRQGTTGPVWRGNRAVPSGQTFYGLPLTDLVRAFYCLPCATATAMLIYGSRECGWCRRSVSYGGTGAQPAGYCTWWCELSARTQRRLAARRMARQRRCGHCGDAFTAPRRDAAYCSPACRQAAYRKRLVDQAAKRAYGDELMADYNNQLNGG